MPIADIIAVRRRTGLFTGGRAGHFAGHFAADVAEVLASGIVTWGFGPASQRSAPDKSAFATGEGPVPTA